MSRKQKYYVVWEGTEPGVYTSWEACQNAVIGFPGAKYKSYKTQEEAEEAWELGYVQDIPTEQSTQSQSNKQSSIPDQQQSTTPPAQQQTPPQMRQLPEAAINNALAVDAACSGNPGMMEYRGVYLKTGKEIFHYGPVYGTNNIGEFLAIVHALALLKQQGLHDMPIYSDSVNAQLWVRRRQARTTLKRDEKTEQLYKLIERAEGWLRNNTYNNQIIKWPTEEWGEIPADFGRK